MTFDVATSADPGDGDRKRRQPHPGRSIAAEVLKKKVKLKNNIVPPPPLLNGNQSGNCLFDMQGEGTDENYDDDDNFAINKLQSSRSSRTSHSTNQSQTTSQTTISSDSKPSEPLKQRSVSETILELSTLLANFPQLQPYLKYKLPLERKGEGEYSLPHSSTFFENACEACLDHGDVCLFDDKDTSMKCLPCTKFGGKCIFRNLEGLTPEVHFVCGRCQMGFSKDAQRNPGPVLPFSPSTYLQNTRIALAPGVTQAVPTSLSSSNQSEQIGPAAWRGIGRINPSREAERNRRLRNEPEIRQAMAEESRAPEIAQAEIRADDTRRSQLNGQSQAGNTTLRSTTRTEQRTQDIEGYSTPVLSESRRRSRPRSPTMSDAHKRRPSTLTQAKFEPSDDSMGLYPGRILPRRERIMDLKTNDILFDGAYYGQSMSSAQDMVFPRGTSTIRQNDQPPFSPSLSSSPRLVGHTCPPSIHSQTQGEQQTINKAPRFSDSRVHGDSHETTKSHVESSEYAMPSSRRNISEEIMGADIPHVVAKQRCDTCKTLPSSCQPCDRRRRIADLKGEVEQHKRKKTEFLSEYQKLLKEISNMKAERGNLEPESEEFKRQLEDILAKENEVSQIRLRRTRNQSSMYSKIKSIWREERALEDHGPSTFQYPTTVSLAPKEGVARIFQPDGASKIFIKQSEDGLQSLTIDSGTREMYEMRDARKQLGKGFEEAQGGEVIIRKVVGIGEGTDTGGEDEERKTSGIGVAEYWKNRLKEEHESLDGKFWDYHPRKHR